MFLIRTAFWLVILILLLPANEHQQREVYGTAEAAVQDLRTFCVRNPEVCATGREAFETFSQKAQFGARMVMDFVKDAAPNEIGSYPATDDGRPLARGLAPRREDRGTLTEDDLKLAWSAPRG